MPRLLAGVRRRARGRAQDDVARAGFERAGVSLPTKLFRWGVVEPLVRAIPRGGYVSYNAQQWLRGIARDNAPRVPHDTPEAAFELWWAWYGSRLPVGRLTPPETAP